MLRERLDATAEEHAFYLALYGTPDSQDDLTRPDSAWVVRLIDSTGAEIAPREIAPIARPGTLETRYFPYTSVWRRAFRLRFPAKREDGQPTIAREAEWFGLRFAGPLGSAELVWRLVAPR